MLGRLFPLGVKVTFEDRAYKLGEAIILTVELRPRRDIEVREGRVDLIREEVWREVFTVMMPVKRGYAPAMSGQPPSVSQQRTKTSREAYVHSSILFLEDTQLASGRTCSYDARLEIGSEAPPHARDGKVTWRLVTTANIPGARDIKARRLVRVTQG